MIDINSVAPYIGMGIVSIGIAIIYFLAYKGEHKNKKPKRVHHHKTH